MSDESATSCHCFKYEVATSCGQLYYVSVTEEGKVTYVELLALFVIPKNPEDLGRGLDRDDRLEGEAGSRS